MAPARATMDWDKLKVFHAAAEAGSFTHAGEQLGLSQSAVSRQVSALEQELAVSLFHRHARGLILTEQGELLYRTAHEVFMKLEAARTKLTDSRERPNGDLRVTTTPGLGVHWLTPRLGEFHRTVPRDPHHPARHRRRARPVDARGRRRHPHAPAGAARRYSAQAVLGALPRLRARRNTSSVSARRARSTISTITDLLMLEGGSGVPSHLQNRNWLVEAGRNGKGPRKSLLTVNNVLGLVQACQRGLGLALLPDYLVENSGLVQLFSEADEIALDCYFVYPEELKSVARVQVFRDFLVANAQRWNF